MVFLPIWDLENPLRRTRHAYVTYALMAACVAVFCLLQSGLFLDESFGRGLDVLFGVIPLEITTDRQVVPDAAFIPETLTLFTYMFLHGGWVHLAGNMLFLWVFGDNVEDALGHLRFFLFYLLCGVMGGLVQAFLNPTSETPVVGASAAIAGVLGAYLVLYPKVKIWVLFSNVIPLKLGTRYVLGSWALVQVLSAIATRTENVAWWGHIGGMLTGILLIFAMRPRADAIVNKLENVAPPEVVIEQAKPPPRDSLPR